MSNINRISSNNSIFLKVYHSFGSAEHVTVIGHTFKKEPYVFKTKSNSFFRNMKSLMKIFNMEVAPNISLRLDYQGKKYFSKSEFDGFFRFDLKPDSTPTSGWHEITVVAINEYEEEIASNTGKIIFPPESSYTFISDIDDTIMKSYSATIFKRLYELLSRNPVKRRIFDNTAIFYSKLAEHNTKDEEHNPFFYVSSSEWNLYDYLKTVFRNHKLPEGVFLLNSIKNWNELILTGKNGHEGKLMRIARVILSYPHKRYVLMGDNSQKDPSIYAAICERYNDNIHAVLIRNVRKDNVEDTEAILSLIKDKGINVCLFKKTQEAIAYCEEIGLISK